VPCGGPPRFDQPSRGSILLTRVSVAAGIVLALGALLPTQRRLCGWHETKLDIAKATVKKYVYEAYPSWSQLHPEQRCPRSLIELDEFTNSKLPLDPWGMPYVMYCSTAGLVVMSTGDDRAFNTDDDIWSQD
jgi:hypothetical protein